MTPKQKECLDFITGYLADKGFSPTYEEIVHAMGLKSKGNVHRYIEDLEILGKIRRTAGKHRSIEIMPEGAIDPLSSEQVRQILLAGVSTNDLGQMRRSINQAINALGA